MDSDAALAVSDITCLDYSDLAKRYPYLSEFLQDGRYTFSTQGQAALTKALFKEWCKIDIDVLEGHLIPALPSRVAYLRIVDRVLKESEVASPDSTKGLDVGTGAYGVYAILGAALFGWDMTGVDIDQESVSHCQKMVETNKLPNVTITEADGLLNTYFHFTVCNPPFYDSIEEMERKYNQKEALNRDMVQGTATELVYKGGEVAFVKGLIDQSKGKATTWYSSMIGLKSSVQELIDYLLDLKVHNFFVRSYQLGNTKRWVLFWSRQHFHAKVYHHEQDFKSIHPTVKEGYFDLEKAEAILEVLNGYLTPQNDQEGALSKLSLSLPGDVWSRAYRRHPDRLQDSPLIVDITPTEIHWLYGESYSMFQSFYMYLLGKLKA